MNNLLPYLQASKKLNIKEKIGQLFMPAAFVNDTGENIQELEKLIQECHVGGLCFFHSRASAATNYEGKKEVVYNENSFDTLKALIQRYQNISHYPLLIAIDAEWGLAMRIENTPQYPYSITLGAIQDNPDLIFEVGKNIALDCKAAGIHWNLSPVVDINNNPNNPVIGYRSFGQDKYSVTEKAIAFLKGTQSEGVLTSIKHFPGHGDTETDSHLGLPLIDKSKQELIDNELYPFQKLIDEGVDSVMVGHLSVPALAKGKKVSSSISKAIIKGVLRGEMGFDGLVISDAMNMHAVSKMYPTHGQLEWLAFDAGNDLLCFTEHTREGIATILKNATESQIEKSFGRVWKLKEKAVSITVQKDVPLVDPDGLNKKLAEESLTLYKGSTSAIPDFKKNDFIAIEISQNIENQFFKNINKNKEFRYISLFDSMINDVKNEIEEQQHILLALFPTQIKPTDDFGITAEELQFINELIRTKNVVLYLFGNPYVLNLIDTEKAKAVVMVYQNFKVFQEAASEHFLGNLVAKGKSPVTIDHI